ncbi:MAG: amino acid adenylation domain-containing protein [Bacteroidales bacterium]|nr:amino acid adenylation domain-containing protein [Bacteroidales bacterium]
MNQPDTLVARLLHQAALSPERKAVFDGENSITYGELARRSDQQARWLISQGLQPEEPVVLHHHRSIDMVVDMVAILLAGGAWVPVAADQPPARIVQLIKEVGPRFVLSHTDAPLVLGMNWIGNSKKQQARSQDYPEVDLPVCKESSLAYILFTSGSTGTPKGVMVEHGSVVNMLEAFEQRAPLPVGFHALSVCPVVFDVSVWEIFSSLCYGGTLHLADPSLVTDIPAFTIFLKEHGIQSGYFPPGVLSQLGIELQQDPEGIVLKRLLVGVEPIAGDVLERFATLPSKPLIVNGYGPTEATVCATFFNYNSQDRNASRIPIGKALPNCSVMLLDHEWKPVQTGSTGQIAIGGAGLARGYLGQKKLTEEKFVTIGGERYYLTGDYAHELNDGNLVFGGRSDFQVKVHGHRIETGEIESVVESMPGIRAVSVVLLGESASEHSLGCFYEHDSMPTADYQAVREWLTARLPSYMIPHHFVPVEKMPRTPNGKIDRKVLAQSFYRSNPAETPPTLHGVDKSVVGLWHQVTKRWPASPSEHFFSSGGDSLSAMYLAAHLGELTGTRVSIRVVFENPSPLMLSNWLSHNRTNPPYTQPLPSYNEDAPFPLTFTQQRPWLLFKLGGPFFLYNLPVAFHLTGMVDAEKLERSFRQLIATHEAFRLSFEESEGKGFQRLSHNVDFHLNRIALPESKQQEQELLKLIEAESVARFDPSRAPLLRASLVHLGGSRYVLVVVTHHLVMDGWSWNLVMNELELFYNQATANDSLPALKKDGWQAFAMRQQHETNNDGFSSDVKFFERYLQNAPPFLPLPAQKTRPARQTFKGHSIQKWLDAPLVNAVEKVSAMHDVSSFMVFMANFGYWLCSLTRFRDLVAGTMSAARNSADDLHAVGFFSDSLPVRFVVPEDVTFGEWLLTVKENLLEVSEHQSVPFEWLLRKLNPPRDLSYHPVFQVMLVHQRSEKETPRFDGVETSPMHLPYPGSKLDLTLYVTEYPGKTHLMVEFNTDLFDSEWMALQIENFISMLWQFTSNPNLLLEEVSLVTEKRIKQLVALGQSVGPPEGFIAVQELIRQQVEINPDHQALFAGGASYSYRWLWDYSGAVAAEISSCCAPGSPVALLGSRTPEMLASMLAVLRAGCWMIPLSDQLPASRLQYILRDASAGVAISHGTPGEQVLDLPLKIIDASTIDTTKTLIGEHSDPSLTAYCIYTSGTSGNPKGVMVSQQNMSTFVRAAIKKYGIHKSDRVLQFASLTFDASVEEIWCAWCGGATLVLRNDEMISSPAHFISETTALNVTVLDLPTAYFHHLAGALANSELKIPAELRLVILGGEALQAGMVEKWQQMPGGVPKLVNTYGPTETTVVATWWDVPNPVQTNKILIGKPVDGASVCVVDDRLRLVPLGVTGELLIGGHTVSKGYLNLPQHTQRSFVNVSFDPSTRYYRTGDLVRMDLNGDLEFLGRADDQLKIRGFRVEPGEIEKVVGGWPGITDVVVGIANHPLHGSTLCCWFVASGDPDLEELRGWVEWQLPDYMVPSAWVRLDSIPLNHAGKTDKASLPAPQINALPESSASWTPSDGFQKDLALVWSSVLGVRPSQPDDNFFLQGGHSLLAATLIAAIKEQFGAEITLRGFFNDPTFSGLAKLVQSKPALVSEQLHPVEPHQWDTPVPLSASQYRIWFLEQLESPGSAFSIPLAFKIEGRFNLDLFQSALNKLVAFRQVLRSVVKVAEGGQPSLAFVDKHEYSISFADLSSLGPDKQVTELTLRIQRNEHIRFEIALWPLFRVSVVKLSETSWYLLLNFHHLIADNRTIGLLVKELGQLYNQLLVNPEALPSVESPSYTDYIFWQQQWLESDEAHQALEAWRKRLHDAPRVLPLPTDRQRPTRQSFAGDAITLHLPPDLTLKLRESGAHKGASMSHVLLACYAVVLQRYSGQSDFVAGVPVAGRNAPRSENIMGVTINNLPVRLQTQPGDTFWQLLDRTRQAMLDALALQEVPFEKMVQVLKLRPDMATTPVFQVMFNMLNAHSEELTLRGCSSEFVEPATHTSKYDLSLIVTERDDSLWLTFEYSTALFDASTIRFLSRAFVSVATAVAASPASPLANVGLLQRSDEWHPLWRPPVRTPFPRTTLPALFSDTARQYADATAIVCGQRHFTYSEVADRVQHLASALFSVGCQPGCQIGVMVERNEWLPVALLAVLRAGASYVPLDPIFPPERIAAIVEDAGVEMFLVSKATKRNLPAGRFRTISVDDPTVMQIPLLSVMPEVKMSSAAYTIFTSGSTGRPKGVVISHNALTNFLWSIRREPGVNPSDKLLAVTTVSFDIAALELFTPLIAGATLVIADDEEQHDARLLAQTITNHRITLMQATPATWRMMLLTGWLGESNLTMLCGGEALPSELAAQLLNRGKALWNMYGPTETTIWSMVKKVDAIDPDVAVVPLGNPVANNFIYIADENLNPVPPGVPGEILIGGEGVALGYWNNSELTASRFVSDPFDPTPGARLYKTGDLARRKTDGSIHFLGRNDHQIKLRGFRIEPGEIEQALATHQGVEQALVMLRHDNGSAGRLVAYLLKRKGSPLAKGSLKDFLSKKLPDYMIPSAFVWLDEFPKTPNGKTDRKALPAPELPGVNPDSSPEPPRDADEAIMMEIWREVLGLSHLSATDDFFDLGGNSLMAVGLMAKIELRFQVRLPLASLFQHSNLRDLTRHTHTGLKNMSWRSLVTIRPMGDKPPVFLIHGAGLNVLLYNTLVTHMPPDQPVYALQAKGLDGKEKPLETIEEIAAHYISEIRTVSPMGPFALAGFSLGGIVAFEMARQLKEMGLEPFFVGMFDTVAYTSLNNLSPHEKRARMRKFRRNQILFNLQLLFTESWSHRSHLIGLKIKSFKRMIDRYRLQQKEHKNYVAGDRDKLQSFALPVHEVNNRAGERYHLVPSPVRIDLFKASRQTFFIEEPKTYGWAQYASNGVVVHEVPGEHNTIFHPPHDKQFAVTLQRCLDEAHARFLNKKG